MLFTRTVKLAWDSQVLVVLLQVITWLTLCSGCMDFSRVLKPLIEKMGTLEQKWGPNGDPKTEKVPMGTHEGAVFFPYM